MYAAAGVITSRSRETKPGPRAKAAAIVEAIATKIGGRDFLLLAHTAQHTLSTQCFLTTC